MTPVKSLTRSLSNDHQLNIMMFLFGELYIQGLINYVWYLFDHIHFQSTFVQWRRASTIDEKTATWSISDNISADGRGLLIKKRFHFCILCNLF